MCPGSLEVKNVPLLLCTSNCVPNSLQNKLKHSCPLTLRCSRTFEDENGWIIRRGTINLTSSRSRVPHNLVKKPSKKYQFSWVAAGIRAFPHELSRIVSRSTFVWSCSQISDVLKTFWLTDNHMCNKKLDSLFRTPFHFLDGVRVRSSVVLALKVRANVD